MPIRFCHKQHQLECVEQPTQTYACIECQRLYQVIDGGILMQVEYRPVHDKDPFYFARQQKETRARLKRNHDLMRNNQHIQALRGRTW